LTDHLHQKGADAAKSPNGGAAVLMAELRGPEYSPGRSSYRRLQTRSPIPGATIAFTGLEIFTPNGTERLLSTCRLETLHPPVPDLKVFKHTCRT
jgi:hypothetical protein